MIDILSVAKNVLSAEVAALIRMSDLLGDGFVQAVELILARKGRVVVVGMGKSGLIGRKIAATMASTGTSAFFVHPAEAFHGDLGMIHPSDVLLMISNSGETEELVRLLPFLQHQKNTIIAMTGGLKSTLANYANAVLDVSVEREACNNNLAPTSSTTATLAMGDALAVVLSTARAFQPEDFARFHPGGSLGRKLLTRVADVMHRNNLPFCRPTSEFRDVVHTITRGRLGMTMVMEGDNLKGIITDGDVRRAFEKYENPLQLRAQEIMSVNPVTISSQELFGRAEEKMRDAKINSLVVVGEADSVVGVLQIYDAEASQAQI